MPPHDDFLLLILSSPSGAGKTTLTRMLLEECPELRFSVSHTTRAPRSNEVDGRDYHFVDRARFDALVEERAFLEWAEVHGNRYGTSTAEIGSKVNDVVSVFILPPSMPELERRLRGRASETEETLSRRYAVAEREIEHYALFHYVIVNDDVKRAFDELRSITVAERARRQRRAPLAEALLRAGRLS